AKRNITLESVERHGGVFPPGRVCKLERLATPAKLVQVHAELSQEAAPLVRAFQVRDQLRWLLLLEQPREGGAVFDPTAETPEATAGVQRARGEALEELIWLGGILGLERRVVEVGEPTGRNGREVHIPMDSPAGKKIPQHLVQCAQKLLVAQRSVVCGTALVEAGEDGGQPFLRPQVAQTRQDFAQYLLIACAAVLRSFSAQVGGSDGEEAVVVDGPAFDTKRTGPFLHRPGEAVGNGSIQEILGQRCGWPGKVSLLPGPEAFDIGRQREIRRARRGGHSLHSLITRYPAW